MKDYARAFYLSRAWEQTRAAYMAYRHGICERCGRPARVVHHRRYITPENINDPSVTLDWANLEALCQECHNREHSAGAEVREGLAFTADGQLVETGRREPTDGGDLEALEGEGRGGRAEEPGRTSARLSRGAGVARRQVWPTARAS